MLEINKIHFGDCLELMKEIPDRSIDCIICDLPYGLTACLWDIIIPFNFLWDQYKRIIKNYKSIILFGQQPFTSKLILSNLEWFKYELIWEKTKACNFFQAKNMALKKHENIIIFSDGTCANRSSKKMVYNPQGTKNVNKIWSRPKLYESEHNFLRPSHTTNRKILQENYPGSIIKIKSEHNPPHPTQKPVELIEYLLKTYSNENDLILDNCAGSGTTGVACINTNRNYILIEKEEKYYKIAKERLGEKENG